MILPVDDADRKTPPGVIITADEKVIVIGAVRTFAKPIIPLLPKLAAYCGPALVVWLASILHAQSVKKDTDKQVKEVEETTDRAYKAVAAPAKQNDDALAAALAALVKRMDAAEATQKAQGALILARPTPALRRIDRALLKAVKDNAAKDSRELAARKPKVAPAITPIPLTIPPAPDAPAPVQPQAATP